MQSSKTKIPTKVKRHPMQSQVERDTLVTEHFDVVRYVVRSLRATLPAHIDIDELESAGQLGLLDAAEKFDQSKHVQFRSYAQFRIRGAILDSLRLSDWSPRTLRRMGRKVEDAMQSVSQRQGRLSSDEEIAAEMRLPLLEYQQLLGKLQHLEIGSLDAKLGDESEDQEVAYVAGPAQDEPLFRCLQGELQQHLAEAIDGLPERERLVISLTYFEEMNLKEVANVLGIGESRASQIRSSAVLHLRSSLHSFASEQRSRNERTGFLHSAA